MARTVYFIKRPQPGRYKVEQLSEAVIADNIWPKGPDDHKNLLGVKVTPQDFDFQADLLDQIPLLRQSDFSPPFNTHAVPCQKPKMWDEIINGSFIAIIQPKDGVTLQQIANTTDGFDQVLALCETFDSYAPA
jgi:hypothetical protein